MIAEQMISLCKLAQTSLAQKIWHQTKRTLVGIEECQTRALSTESLSEGLLHPPSLVSRPSPLLRDVSFPILGPVLVVSLLV